MQDPQPATVTRICTVGSAQSENLIEYHRGKERFIVLQTNDIELYALEAGADLVGVASAEPLADEASDLERWLHLGYHGTMSWMAENTEVRSDPRLLLPQCRSIIVIAVNYYTPQLHLRFPNFPRISRYAWGRDYHKVLGGIIKKIETRIREMAREEGIEKPKFTAAVDSAPFRNKVWAQRAGLGWIGKNCLLITRQFGSWVFLGALLTTLDLQPDDKGPHPDHCGNCTRCMDACPTNAIVDPGKLDARACLSYLTVEHKGQIPVRHLENLSGWVFGCDTCQDVCPWNRFAKPSRTADFQPREGLVVPDLHLLSQLTDEQFASLAAGTSLKRAGRERLRHNALAVMGLL